MSKKIGPSFAAEVIAAGLGGLPFSWSTDGVIFGMDALPPGQQAKLQAVLAAHSPATVPIPTTVTPRQARLALLSAGLLDQTAVVVKAAGGAAQITWDYATEINRSDPLIKTLGQQLKLTDEQIDALFTYAAQQ